MNPLIEKALTVRVFNNRLRFSDDEMGLAIAWANGSVTLNQVQRAMSQKSTSHTYTFLARALRQAIIENNEYVNSIQERMKNAKKK